MSSWIEVRIDKNLTLRKNKTAILSFTGRSCRALFWNPSREASKPNAKKVSLFSHRKAEKRVRKKGEKGKRNAKDMELAQIRGITESWEHYKHVWNYSLFSGDFGDNVP